MDKYFNDNKYSKNDNLNSFMEKIKNNKTDFNENFLFNELLDSLLSENSFNNEAVKRFKILIYNYYDSHLVKLGLMALFSKLPFSRSQDWKITRNGIKISAKELPVNVAFIILFHSLDLEKYKKVCQLLKSGWKVENFLFDPIITPHLDENTLEFYWHLIKPAIKFCDCKIINGFHTSSCGVKGCCNKVMGMRHLKIGETTFNVTLCSWHMCDVSHVFVPKDVTKCL